LLSSRYEAPSLALIDDKSNIRPVWPNLRRACHAITLKVLFQGLPQGFIGAPPLRVPEVDIRL
jgi:hypothetical protein